LGKASHGVVPSPNSATLPAKPQVIPARLEDTVFAFCNPWGGSLDDPIIVLSVLFLVLDFGRGVYQDEKGMNEKS
jgi:hypothetical protein